MISGGSRSTGLDYSSTGPAIRQYYELMWPALQALKELGGSATVRGMYERVVEDEGFTEEQQAVAHKDGRMSEIDYRLHWARSHLKAIGAAENSARGVWAITDKGQAISQQEMHAATKVWRAEIRAKRLDKHVPDEDEEQEETESLSWKDQLVERILELPPGGFERLAQRILREAGFVNVTGHRQERGTAASTEWASTACRSCRSPCTSSARGTEEP